MRTNLNRIFITIGILLFTSCNSSEIENSYSEKNGFNNLSGLNNLADSVAYFHNLVCSEYINRQYKAKSKSPEINCDKDNAKEMIVEPFVEDIYSCTEYILSSYEIDVQLTEEELESIVDLVSPLVTELIYSNKTTETILNELIDKMFPEDQKDEVKEIIYNDFSIDEYITRCDRNSSLEYLIKIGSESKEFWTSRNTKGKVNYASYTADGLGGALGIIFGASRVIGVFCLVVSTAWSIAVDTWEPIMPEDGTNCD